MLQVHQEFSFCGGVFCRGLQTALVEREDFASGTSSKSTKLVHGGVRYLEKAVFNLDYGQLKLVFEALHERKRLLQNAPHLSSALPIMTVRVPAPSPCCSCSCETAHDCGAVLDTPGFCTLVHQALNARRHEEELGRHSATLMGCRLASGYAYPVCTDLKSHTFLGVLLIAQAGVKDQS